MTIHNPSDYGYSHSGIDAHCRACGKRVDQCKQNRLPSCGWAAEKIAEYHTEGGEHSEVWFQAGEYTVEFFNKAGVHMDASDYVTEDYEEAIMAADPGE